MLLGLGLGMDAMSVSAAIGVKWNGPHQKFRLGWHFGLFQFLMPCAGFALGKPLASVLSTYGKYAAAAMVFGLGAKMLWEVMRSHPGSVAEKVDDAEERVLKKMGRDPTKGLSLVAISVATSLDALVVGFSLGISSGAGYTWSHLLYDATIIGLITGLMALVGVNLGQRAGQILGRPAEIAAALILMALAVSFLLL